MNNNVNYLKITVIRSKNKVNLRWEMQPIMKEGVIFLKFLIPRRKIIWSFSVIKNWKYKINKLLWNLKIEQKILGFLLGLKRIFEQMIYCFFLILPMFCWFFNEFVAFKIFISEFIIFLERLNVNSKAQNN